MNSMPNYLARRFRGKKAPLKAALLDQRIIAGLGNIYVCEALHRAGLSPTRKAGTLARKAGRIRGSTSWSATSATFCAKPSRPAARRCRISPTPTARAAPSSSASPSMTAKASPARSCGAADQKALCNPAARPSIAAPARNRSAPWPTKTSSSKPGAASASSPSTGPRR